MAAARTVVTDRERTEPQQLPAMRDAGLLVTINTDDPAMTETDLGQEYRVVGEAYGMSLASLAELAIEGIESTWLDAADRSRLRADFEDAVGELLRV